ncbi:hypothetical protein [Buttiauxella massiliensis]|uniref:hypothetical protein n=1 Tax=Buttiauxella massiliensis TaxID=2831590 RepID=UPI00125FB820|nr:hypothetical protein [Buttiauxella massiliensis]
MNKNFLMLLMVVIVSHSTISQANDAVMYGYDKSNDEIYAQKGNNKIILKFEENYTENPSYSFDFFSGTPAIIADGRSLHDSTVYATLKYTNDKFIIDCLYSNVKSKKNGVLVKEGVCGLEFSPPEKYSDYIDKKVNEIEVNMDSTDTSLILTGKVNYLPIVVFNSKERLLYKLYNNKQALMDDNYSILSLTSKGECEVFVDSPWVVYNAQITGQEEIMSEKISDGKIELNKAIPSLSDKNMCSRYPAISINQSKAYFYDSMYNMKGSYLIKGDKVNLLSVSADGKWCKARYINNKNKSTVSNILCSDLNI